MIVHNVRSERELNMLYNESALAFEGLKCDDKTLTSLYNWIRNNGCKMILKEVFVISGAYMNEVYKLTDDNAYPDELTIVCIPLSYIINPEKLFKPMRRLHGKWFDNIVDSNTVRQNRIRRSE